MISVIIPSYNRSKLISRAIDSVLEQTCQAGEIIVVDDGSTDNSCELIRQRYPDVRLFQETHRGVSAARNTGIRQAQYEWLAFLDSDDQWLPQKLGKQVEALDRQPGFKIVHTDEKWIRDGKPLQQQQKHRKLGGWIFQHCLPLCLISPSSILIHQSVFTSTGNFDETLPVCEDYDMWLRICNRYPVLYLDEVLLVKHGGHDDQLSRQYWGMDRFRIQALAGILESGDLKEPDRTAAIDMLLYKIEIYLKGARKHNNPQHVEEFSNLRQRYTSASTGQSIHQ